MEDQQKMDENQAEAEQPENMEEKKKDVNDAEEIAMSPAPSRLQLLQLNEVLRRPRVPWKFLAIRRPDSVRINLMQRFNAAAIWGYHMRPRRPKKSERLSRERINVTPTSSYHKRHRSLICNRKPNIRSVRVNLMERFNATVESEDRVLDFKDAPVVPIDMMEENSDENGVAISAETAE